MKKQSPALLAKRIASLLPDGLPKYVRCYDLGEDEYERYTICYSGLAPVLRSEFGGAEYPYVGMSANPTHPQGLCQHGCTKGSPCDVVNGWPPAMGRKNHLGKRIPFTELPQDCQDIVMKDYKEYWDL